MLTLMYHDAYVLDKLESGFNTTSACVYKIKSDAFSSQIEMIDRYIRRNALAKDAVRFTFDDGGVSSYTIFAPILEKYGYKGYFFIATQFIGVEGFLSETQIRELSERGHIIGGHSETHRQRMNDLSFSEIFLDWKECSDRLEHILGYRITCCSLPCGYSSTNILMALKRLGYTDVYTSEATEKVRQVDCIRLYGRYGVKDSMSNEYVVSIVTSLFVRFKIKIQKALLNLLKRILGRIYVNVREIIMKIM